MSNENQNIKKGTGKTLSLSNEENAQNHNQNQQDEQEQLKRTTIIDNNNNDNNNNDNNNKHQPTSTTFIARYNGPPSDKLTTSQEQIQKSILQSRPKTGLSGPFGPWLSNPKICSPAQTLGKVCRYDTSLTKYQSELIILLTGARHYSHTEFDIHVNEGLDAGIDMEIINSIPHDDEYTKSNVEERLLPLLEHNEKDRVLVLFVTELLIHSGLIGDELYDMTKDIVGGGKDEVLVEIVSIVGYYTFVAYTLNMFRVPSK